MTLISNSIDLKKLLKYIIIYFLLYKNTIAFIWPHLLIKIAGFTSIWPHLLIKIAGLTSDHPCRCSAVDAWPGACTLASCDARFLSGTRTACAIGDAGPAHALQHSVVHVTCPCPGPFP
jgi:hypothetical protein